MPGLTTPGGLSALGNSIFQTTMGMPEPIESLSGADAKAACSAICFLDGRDFEVVVREAELRKPQRDDHVGSNVLRWVFDVIDCACAAFPKVTIEMLLLLCGSYQLHIEIERRVRSLRKRWWAPGWNLTERRCQQIARCIQQHLTNHVERLSLLLPPRHILLAQHPLSPAALPHAATLAPQHGDAPQGIRKMSVQVGENVVAAAPEISDTSKV